jgi:hypothetical protein
MLASSTRGNWANRSDGQDESAVPPLYDRSSARCRTILGGSEKFVRGSVRLRHAEMHRALVG